ncbi:Hypothetical_protein [Hexamita inflata]|uniref:Hypothetical_protein n=1 Tax=Hexamita inflata TaxID=28002 RepID=A0ABP1GER0_9EUKA
MLQNTNLVNVQNVKISQYRDRTLIHSTVSPQSSFNVQRAFVSAPFLAMYTWSSLNYGCSGISSILISSSVCACLYVLFSNFPYQVSLSSKEQHTIVELMNM